MKHRIVLIALATVFLLAACTQTPATEPTPTTSENPTNSVEEVTIYIPESVTAIAPDGTVQMILHYVFEEGWQEKEQFSVTVQIEDPSNLLEDSVDTGTLMSFIYSEKHMVQETMGTNRTETVLDENGRAISQTMTYLMETAPHEKMETLMTYDAFGRLLTQETKNYTRGEAEPQVTVTTVSYTETDTGSEGRSENGGIIYVRVYDKDYRLICSITLINGEETSRTEQEYDGAGNLIKAVSYFQGEVMSEMHYTYTAVEVSAEFVERMPQFNRAE